MALPADLLKYKDSPAYQPMLRSVLKSQIQLLVEQLHETGEETLILTANVKNQDVSQLGSESGKKFVEMYDDFKSEFLGFCQKRDRKRKIESPQPVMLFKKAMQSSSGVHAAKQSPRVITNIVQSQKSAAGTVPKVSSARVLVCQGQSPVQIATVQSPKSVQKGSEASHSSGPVVVTVQSSGPADQNTPTALNVLEISESELVGFEEMGEQNEESFDPNSSEDQAVSEQQTQSTSTVKQTKVVTKAGSDNGDGTVSSGVLQINRTALVRNTCTQCGKVFGYERDLKVHLRSHSGVKPYRCEKCDISYSLKRSLSHHMKKEHRIFTSVDK